jgi:hypothetical protein
MAVARGAYMGDPGLFSFVGKIAKGIGKVAGTVGRVAVGAAGGLLRGGPLGAVAGGLQGAGVLKTPTMPVLMSSNTGPLGRSTGIMPGGVSIGGGLQIGPGGVGIGGGLQIGQPGAPATMVGTNGQVCRGHMNRTGYYSAKRGGLVAPGTVCVTNRRMNPLNPRALSRSMRRLSSAAKAMRTTEKMIQRLARKAGGSPRRASGCAHKGCRK